MADYIIAGVCFSRRGVETANTVNELISHWKGEKEVLTEWLCADDESYEGFEKLNGTVRQWTAERFRTTDIFIFVCPTIMAVRCFGPYITDQIHDPAVLCIDENGKFSIPLLSGRRGDAFDLAEYIEEKLGIKCVTANMDGDAPGFDIREYAIRNNMVISNEDYAKEVNAAIDSGDKVGFNASFPVIGEMPRGLQWTEEGPLGVYISPSYNNAFYDHTLWLIPKVLTVGVVCGSAFDIKAFDRLLTQMLNDHNYFPEGLLTLAVPPNLGRDFSLQAYCMEKGIKMTVVDPEAFSMLIDEHKDRDKAVCEAAAVYVSKGRLVCECIQDYSISCSIAMKTAYVRFKDV